MRVYITLVLLGALVVIGTNAIKLCDRKCYPGMPCWPSDETFAQFFYNLDGDVVIPMSPNYHQVNRMENGRVLKQPASIVFIKSIGDVKKCLSFAKLHNLRVTILSSGHSYIGRSAHDGSLLINLSNMTEMAVKPEATSRSPGGEITVQTGNTWARVYEEVNKYNRIVVGGSAHTVSMGGYTQGGGHSPMSRSLGLAVDNLLEATLVTAEGHLVTLSPDGTVDHDTGMSYPDTSLFWAIRGGGGGTWGVIITYTFKLHIPPHGFVRFISYYPLVVNNTVPGLAILESLVHELGRLPSQWGGYVVISSVPTGVVGALGSIMLSLLHFGPWDTASRAAISTLQNDPNSVYKEFFNHSTFWDYEKNINDPSLAAYRAYIINSLVPPTVDAARFAQVMTEGLFDEITPGVSGWGGTFTMLGGKMQETDYSSTPVNPGFRDALFSVSLGRLWSDPRDDSGNIAAAKRFNGRLIELGNGVYFNEPAEHLDNWKTDYWGRSWNYDKLLLVKEKWDVDNLFCCHNCVGSDREDDRNPDCQWVYPIAGAAARTGNLLLGAMLVILSVLLMN